MINLITAMVRKVYGGWWSGGVVEWWSGMTATSETKLWELVNVVNVVNVVSIVEMLHFLFLFHG